MRLSPLSHYINIILNLAYSTRRNKYHPIAQNPLKPYVFRMKTVLKAPSMLLPDNTSYITYSEAYPVTNVLIVT